MKRILAAPLLALSLLPVASTADDQDVIDYRRHIMETLKSQTAALGMIMSGAIPDDNAVAHIDNIALTASTALKSFEPKVEGGDAKPEVWSQWDDFSVAHERFRGEDGGHVEDRARAGQGRGFAAGDGRAQLQAVPRRLPGQEAGGRPVGAACACCGSPSRRSPARHPPTTVPPPWSAAVTSPRPPTAPAAIRARAARRTAAAARSPRRSERSIRPTSRRIARPGSATGAPRT